jgi:hypothetical protein
MRAAVGAGLALVLLQAGCFDFRALGGGNRDASASEAQDLAGLALPTCLLQSDCAAGSSCGNGVCVPASSDCADFKAIYPNAVSGVYWLAADDAGAPGYYYCDMELTTPLRLCGTTQASHFGRTHDKANLGIQFMSVLSADLGSCQIWDVRQQDDQCPLGVVPEDMSVLNQCQTLGFIDDVALGKGCPYGNAANYGNCGYTAANPPFWAYGHRYIAADGGAITYAQYTKVGALSTGLALTSAAKTAYATCTTGYVLPLADR